MSQNFDYFNNIMQFSNGQFCHVQISQPILNKMTSGQKTVHVFIEFNIEQQIIR